MLRRAFSDDAAVDADATMPRDAPCHAAAPLMMPLIDTLMMSIRLLMMFRATPIRRHA